MKLVVDTNVLLAAAISEGPPFEVVNLAFGGEVTLVFSRDTFGELADVLMTRRPFDRVMREVRAAYLGHLAERAVWARTAPAPVRCRDPQDQVVLDLAVSANADYLITGDDDLLIIGQVGTIRIRAPAQFLAEIRQR